MFSEIRFRCLVDSLFSLIDNRAAVLTLFPAFAYILYGKKNYLKFYLGKLANLHIIKCHTSDLGTSYFRHILEYNLNLSADLLLDICSLNIEAHCDQIDK